MSLRNVINTWYLTSQKYEKKHKRNSFRPTVQKYIPKF